MLMSDKHNRFICFENAAALQSSILKEDLSAYDTAVYDLGNAANPNANAWSDDAIDFLVDGHEAEYDVLGDDQAHANSTYGWRNASQVLALV